MAGRRAPAPYPWHRLPRVPPDAVADLAALSRVTRGASRPGPGAWPRSWAGVDITAGTPRRIEPLALAAQIPDAHAAVLRLVRTDGAEAVVFIPGLLARSLAADILGLPRDELSAPRTLSQVERGVLLFAAAACAEAWDLDGVQIGAVDAPAVEVAGAVTEPVCAVPLAVLPRGSGQADRAHIALLAIPRSALASPAPLQAASPMPHRGHRLATASVSAPVIACAAAIGARALAALEPRDVVVLGVPAQAVPPGPPVSLAGLLAVGRGGFPVTADGDRVIVTGAYERGAMTEAVADDVTVELSCAVGTVTVAAREVLELQPGQVLVLDRPVGGPVDLVVGRTVIGRGELVDVDGELGVRVLSLSRGA